MEEAQQHDLQKRFKDMKDAAEVQKGLKEMKEALAKVDRTLEENPRLTEQAWVDLLEKKMSSFGNSFSAFDESLNGAWNRNGRMRESADSRPVTLLC